MSVAIQELPDELVVRITKVLARRPEYGVAVPSRRWLERQEEKIKHLPKELLRPSSLKRLAIKIVDRIDPNIVDPQAVLCKTHSTLNPFLIRRLFIALAYEVTVHTDPLRSWQGRTSDPELSAFVGRLDSIAALWTAPQLFHDIYGLAPFDGHHVFVKSSCEACCLAAIGASARALADLRAALIDRMERRNGRGKEPRLCRVVEAWIDQLRRHSESVDRPESCRTLSESLLVDLRMARPQIKAWRAEQKRHHAELRAAQLPVYAELKRTRTGAKIAPLPLNAGHKRRTRNGIPVALVDINGAEGQRRSAMSTNRRESIYRPDSLSGYSSVNERQQAAYNLPTGADPRPSAPEPVRASGPSDGSPTQSFLYRFEQDVPVEDKRDPYDDFEEEEMDENQCVEESRAKVQDWWANQLSKSQLDISQDDTRSVLSMVHPAFRSNASHVDVSDLPTQLQVEKDSEQRANNPRGRSQTAASAWTNCTVYTVDPSSIEPDPRGIPPVPRIPSEYRRNGRSTRDVDRTPQVASQTSVDGAQARSIVSNDEQSTIPFPEYEDPFVNRKNSGKSIVSSSSKTKGKNAPLDWPAPPHGKCPPLTRDNPRLQKFFRPQSDVGSTFSGRRQAFLSERFRPKEEGRNSSVTHHPRIATPTPMSSTLPDQTRPVSYASSSVYSVSSEVPYLDSSRGGTVESEAESELDEPYDGYTTPTQSDRLGIVPSSIATENSAASDSVPIRPDDSASNANWNRRRQRRPSVSSSVTQLIDFRRKM
ncbi:hypothetical protein E0Z10_g6687 [Xylaria hypoxylon]|uniref:Uncharacterized protein n=1 Tax=Xylaria hypoxylon TaxID=37992 RepID=A0A4Z0Z067_9PEZI|nr:hypothetical protein E0Z10_g6687 [Xylaria hypoxylon]